jgi:aminopeptidase N
MHRHLEEPHSFAFESAQTHYAADRAVQARHIRLELALDFEKQTIEGTCTTRLEARAPLKFLTFDAVELEVTAAQIDGKPADFEHSGAKLRLKLNKALKEGQEVTARISYSARPRRGLYFLKPDAGYPKRPLQAWTQGQDEDSRYWFPCLDAPAQKATTEVIATFPANMTMLSNGACVEDKPVRGKRRMHYRLERPHSPYLVTLVVGEFDEVVDESGPAKVRTLFPKGRKEDALRCVSRTAKMLTFFEDFTGQKYPWGDYAQIFVGEFIFGGMENTGATTLTDAVLHDKRAHLDFTAEPLISHELAHQWFGDLLTCRDWPHGWLNEGFATYSEVLWKEHADNVDEADHQRLVDLQAYLEEARERYVRPIVARKFDEPIELFDRHLYEKGALVLHELRRRLGDEDFRRVVHKYVARHSEGAVETVDLARTVEEVTGKNFDRFFDEYVHQAGHVALKVEARFQAEHKSVRLLVKQQQKGEPYHLPLDVQWTVGKETKSLTLELGQTEQVFYLPAAKEPSSVIVDGRREVLGTLDVDKPAGWWREELKSAPWARAQTEAAFALGKDGSAASIDALGTVLKKEAAFWGTRAACAKALGRIHSPHAKAALLKAVGVKHPKARRAVVQALGEFREDSEAVEALRAFCTKGDDSALVESEAARAFGQARASDAVKVLTAMLERPAFMDVIATGALDGLAASRMKEAWKPVLKLTAYGSPAFARRAAVAAMARLAEVCERKHEAVDVLTPLLADAQFRVQMAAIDAAATLNDERMMGPLLSTPYLDGRAKRAAREVTRALREGQPWRKELSSLREDFEKLKGQFNAVKEQVERKRR